MTTPMPNQTDIFLHELQAIENYLITAQDVLKDGLMPDMTGLQKRVADFCMNLEKAPKDVQQACMSDLGKLLAGIDATEVSLRAWNDARNSGGGNEQP